MADVIYYSIVDNIPKIGPTNNQRAAQWLNVTNQTYNKLCENIDNIEFLDSLLSFYSAKKCKKCKSGKVKSSCIITDNLHQYDDALDRLKSFNNGEVGNIINVLETTGLDILISGSSCLASVMKRASHQFEPRDVDIYLKNINKEKVLLIDKCIREQYGGNQIYIVRRPLTLTWWIIGENDVVAEIQLNLLQIKSWIEVFSVYHSDMVCIGYQVLNKKFITHKIRWKNFYSKMLTNEIYITDLFSIDTISILQTVKSKYEQRGFNIKIIGKEPNELQYDKQMMSGAIHMSGAVPGSSACAKSNKSKKQKFDMVEYFRQYYAKCDDFQIDINAADIYLDNENPPRLITIRNHGKNDFLLIPYNIEVLNGIECSILCDNTNLVITGDKCTHSISLKAFILHEIKSCPLCRASIVNPQVRTVDGYNYFKDNYTAAKNKVMDEIAISPRDRLVFSDYDSDEEMVEPLILTYQRPMPPRKSSKPLSQQIDKIISSDIIDIDDFDLLSEEKPKKKSVKKISTDDILKHQRSISPRISKMPFDDSEDEKVIKMLFDDSEDEIFVKSQSKKGELVAKELKITSVTYESDDEKNMKALDGSDEEYFQKYVKEQNIQYHPESESESDPDLNPDHEDKKTVLKIAKLNKSVDEFKIRAQEIISNIRKKYPVHGSKKGRKSSDESIPELIDILSDVEDEPSKYTSLYPNSMIACNLSHETFVDSSKNDNLEKSKKKKLSSTSSVDSTDSTESAEFIKQMIQLIDNNEKLQKLQHVIDDNEKTKKISDLPDVIIGKVAPIGAMVNSQKKYKDSKVYVSHAPAGILDSIYKNEGYDMHKIKNPSSRMEDII